MKINQFTKSYNGRTVLSFPGLELAPGQICCMIGANGSGKSTFAKVVAGIEPDDHHTAVLTERLQVGYSPQKSYAFRMSVADNICLAAPDRAKAADLMAALEISHLAGQRAPCLSGGETARMTLARVLMKKWQLLLLDEPTAAMDIRSTKLAEKLIKDYCRRENCALLLITHSLQQAKRMADQVIFLHQGQICESGPAEKVLTDPADPTTREFLDFYGV